MYDLREDFGFELDRWNQAYQYDTLPIDLKKDELKPGDLVFITATYYNPKMRKQKHDMVHIEIFTGGETGEQTIGARWQKGVVQYFDSYAFVSKSYYNMKYHFKSLDTWLDGICRSHCKEHAWTSSNVDVAAAGKKSIFNPENDYDEDDMNAPDCDDADGNVEVEEKKMVHWQAFVGQGNNERLVKQVLTEQNGFKMLARGMMFSNEYRLKWTQTSMEINYMQFKEGTHLCNHIANATKLLCNKIALIQVLEGLKVSMELGLIKSELYPEISFAPETYRLDVAADLNVFLNS